MKFSAPNIYLIEFIYLRQNDRLEAASFILQHSKRRRSSVCLATAAVFVRSAKSSRKIGERKPRERFFRRVRIDQSSDYAAWQLTRAISTIYE